MAPKTRTPAMDTDIFDKGDDIEITDNRAQPDDTPIDEGTSDDRPYVHVNSDHNGGENEAEREQAIKAMEQAGERPVDIQAAIEEREYQSEHTEAAQRFQQNIANPPAEEGEYFIDLSQADEVMKPMVAGTIVIAACTAAEAKMSNNGNPMLVLRNKVERVSFAPGVAPEEQATYRNRSIRDNLMFIGPNAVTGSRGTLWRAKQAFDAYGIEWPRKPFRTAGELLTVMQGLAESFIGAVCQIEVGVEIPKDDNIDPKTGEKYPPKNTVARYSVYNPAPVTIGGSDDDIPF